MIQLRFASPTLWVVNRFARRVPDGDGDDRGEAHGNRAAAGHAPGSELRRPVEHLRRE
jgi:hypothetical protein